MPGSWVKIMNYVSLVPNARVAVGKKSIITVVFYPVFLKAIRKCISGGQDFWVDVVAEDVPDCIGQLQGGDSICVVGCSGFVA
jgi:hypothetical protein